METVILVDESDREIGTADRELAHLEGKLHRAVSVFVINQSGELLLQRRASTKALFAGLWANTCCTHPRPGEPVVAAGERRLCEEMGIDLRLEHVGTFKYRAEDEDTGYVEHELDHLLIGRSEHDPLLDSQEADAFSWIHVEQIWSDMHSDHKFVPWLKLALNAFPDLGRE